MYIYIHIPFCNNICKYCDFPKLLYDKKYTNKYLDALENEIKSRYKEEKINSIYIGGGTPTSLDLLELKKLLDITKIFKRDSIIEFTIESNVEGLDDGKLKLLQEYGVNRISLGVQSFNDNTLIELNRKHTKKQIFDIVKKIKQYNFDNISIDYIYGIHDDLDEIKNDINSFLELDVPHISCYSLIIEDNTVFGINDRKYIDDNIELKMYKYIEDILLKNGYKHYEISNYGKDGYFSAHNLNYWNNGEYYGYGMGSVSYINNHRISNTKNLTKYIRGNYLENNIYEDLDTRISNTIILGLRKLKGINIEDFYNRFKVDILELYNIKSLIAEGKLIINNGYIHISEKFFYMANDILINFV